jgi:hypothetical protein
MKRNSNETAAIKVRFRHSVLTNRIPRDWAEQQGQWPSVEAFAQDYAAQLPKRTRHVDGTPLDITAQEIVEALSQGGEP